MNNRITHNVLTLLIAVVWFVNGLCCKVLNLVPRHEQIVARILGNEHARILTVIIGCAEIIMAAWILTHFKAKWNALAQLITIGLMNILEASLAPDLLLWGRLNAVFAVLFMGLIYYNVYILGKRVHLEKHP